MFTPWLRAGARRYDWLRNVAGRIQTAVGDLRGLNALISDVAEDKNSCRQVVQELKEALDADIQDRIMKEREMQSYIEEREREVAEREAAWKAELSRREVPDSIVLFVKWG
ncbi:hypothetical protein SASPL_111048 [Salvia splendens]|uniref:Uncharacterized protein n=1 Tax=Salvia splendens TaxID=180675 RepID=A0A8X8Y8B0_SALSN|nr:hypothetical protein SASPL_111048 [Salvia splendens]